jgi:imidazolonepropionase
MSEEAVHAVWTNARLATMTGPQPYGLIDDGALAVRGSDIVWAGPRTSLPSTLLDAAAVRDAGGRCITPGFVDCHTHVVYAGDRSQEFELRLLGADYSEIARRGGGILSTVRATRKASEEALAAAADVRVAELCRAGVTTLEVKSGYGLDRDTELRMLRVARALSERHRVRVRTTYLGLHALDPSWAGDADAYVAFVCDEMLPAIAADGLADAVDAFCEPIAFSAAQVERYFQTAVDLGLPLKLHAEQMTANGGAKLAARFGALSADHLEHATRADLAALKVAGSVPVLLPGAFYYLRETHAPPIAALRDLKLPFALATDCNPGTSPLVSPLLAMNLACTLWRLTPDEALRGFTEHAARALGLGETLGTLQPGRKADFVVWDVEHPAQLVAGIGANPGATVVVGGRTAEEA